MYFDSGIGRPRLDVKVLHLRGISSDGIGMDVHSRCIHQRMCDPNKPFHLHCFMGDQELVKLWMDHFSNVYFDFTGAVRASVWTRFPA